MHSALYLPFFLPLALAWPFAKQQGYGTSSTELHKDLQDLWYTKYTKDDEFDVARLSLKELKEFPSDPTSIYSCVGPKAEDFPGQDEWLSFDQLWEINAPVIEHANDGDQFSDDLQTAIKEVASHSKVDARLILAIIMQESSGNVSIHCTEETACGIMQHRGSSRFDTSNPKSSIKSMIDDGVYGTPNVPGYLSYFNSDSADLAWVNTELIKGNPYAAAHVYNTGHLDSENLSTDRGRSNYYAHDVLSRLQGWNGWKAGCEESKQCDGLGFEKRSCW